MSLKYYLKFNKKILHNEDYELNDIDDGLVIITELTDCDHTLLIPLTIPVGNSFQVKNKSNSTFNIIIKQLNDNIIFNNTMTQIIIEPNQYGNFIKVSQDSIVYSDNSKISTNSYISKDCDKSKFYIDGMDLDLDINNPDHVEKVFDLSNNAPINASNVTFDHDDWPTNITNVQLGLDHLNINGGFRNYVQLKLLENDLNGTLFDSIGADDLKNYILNTAIDNEVIIVQSNVTYNPIILPPNKSLKIKAGFGFNPIISGQYCIQISNGAKNIIISGFTIKNYTTGLVNTKGGAISMETEFSKFNNIIFHNMKFHNAISGSSIVLCHHWNPYYISPISENMSEKLAIVNCSFFHSCVDGNEGAAIVLRSIKNIYLNNNYINGDNVNSRGILIQCSNNVIITNNKCCNFDTNGEGIKVDLLGSGPFTTNGLIENNQVYNAIEGIDIDDSSAFNVSNNTVFGCQKGISLDDSSIGQITNNICYDNSVAGIIFEAGSNGTLFNNNSFNNQDDYQMDNGYTPDSSNTADVHHSFISANQLSYVPIDAINWTNQPISLSDAIDKIAAHIGPIN